MSGVTVRGGVASTAGVAEGVHVVLAGVARKAALLLGDQEYVRLAARAGDADALAAATLLALALEREGVDFHFSTLRALDPAALGRLREERNEVLVLVDVPDVTNEEALGLAGELVLVHDAEKQPVPHDAIAVTAEAASVAGGMEASASALAFGIAMQMSARNEDLTPLALAGALAEGQHAAGGLKGVNAEFASQALEAGALTRAPAGLAFEGATLLEAVAQGVEPYFPGLAGRARAAKKFLDEAGLPADAAPRGLSGEDATRVADALVLRLLSSRAPEGAVESVAQPRWTAAKGALEGEDVADVARAVRGAAVTGAAGRFVSWPWRRDESDLGRAFATEARAFREAGLSALVRAEREGAGGPDGTPLSVEAPDALSVRALADLAAFALAPPRRPVVAHAVEDGRVLVAGRAPRPAVLAGWNVGVAFRDAASAAGGRASGNRASGLAAVPADAWDAFRKALAEAGPS